MGKFLDFGYYEHAGMPATRRNHSRITAMRSNQLDQMVYFARTGRENQRYLMWLEKMASLVRFEIRSEEAGQNTYWFVNGIDRYKYINPEEFTYEAYIRMKNM